MPAHLLGLREWNAENIEEILARSFFLSGYRERKLDNLKGKQVAALFFEPSTRTRFSFEVAARWLSADFYNFPVETSSVLKGETLLDTIQTLKSMGLDVLIIRHPVSGTLEWLKNRVDISMINAGDGSHEHPTQALLDLFTIKKQFGYIEGLKVVMVGDIKYSRVVRSSVWGLKEMGAKVVLVGPPTLLPEEFRRAGVEISWYLEKEMKDADVLYLLRLQKERQRDGLLPSLREYVHLYGLTAERLSLLAPGTMVMHPGPLNPGVEITQKAMDRLNESSLPGINVSILRQVENGIIVRAAVLDYLFKGGGQIG
ncbi:MAG: aspartate carbamoyltransferase catalytic subunit [Firmicutes bacterium]|jgi:aspartate carbamoyltransferase catalytic subunit|nr:aspartate carbamoyltransferase catalytic subunit [Bacillota bacterium]